MHLMLYHFIKVTSLSELVVRKQYAAGLPLSEIVKKVQ